MNEILQLLQFLQQQDQQTTLATKGDLTKVANVLEIQDRQINSIIQEHNSFVVSARATDLFCMAGGFIMTVLVVLLGWQVWRLEKQLKSLKDQFLSAGTKLAV